MVAARWSDAEFEVDEAQLAAVGFLARYRGRTLEAYRHDLRCFFQWTVEVGVVCWRRRARTSSSTGRPLEIGGLRLRRSTVACRRSVASIDSRMSTAGSRRTRPSTCDDLRYIPPLPHTHTRPYPAL